jgi:HK97 family phage prohead protease
VSVTIVGCIADAIGATSRLVTVPNDDPRIGRNFDVKREFMAAPSTEYRSSLAPEVLVDVDHRDDRICGRVCYLERRQGRILAVAEIDGSQLGEGPWAFSPEVAHYRGTDITLKRLAITKKPATCGIGNISAFPGTLRDAASAVVYQDGADGQLIRRAAQYDRARASGQPLVIQEPHKPPAPAAMGLVPSGKIEVRAATKLDISFAKRTIDLVVMPYETETVVAYEGRMIGEIVSRGAFDDINERGDRVRVNRDHDVRRTVGRAVAFDAKRREGLVATCKISDTELGRESLTLAADHVLGGSAGFRVVSEQWQGSSYRRLNRLWLHHIALTPDPAYETADVLAVRNWPTPNLDKARELLLAT